MLNYIPPLSEKGVKLLLPGKVPVGQFAKLQRPTSENDHLQIHALLVFSVNSRRLTKSSGKKPSKDGSASAERFT